MERATKAIQQRYRIIGRQEELAKSIAAISIDKHILIEGAVGVGKTALGMALARYFNRKFYRIDGDERYTDHKLTGWFDPALVVAKGYTRRTFSLGPLTQAMTQGSFLFINELNRMPEGTQNVLLPAMDERQIIIPRIGTIKAEPGFLIIATQNPEEFVGTSQLSEAIRDRFVWIRLDYQTEPEEQEIVKKETGCKDNNIIDIAVKITRKTREDPDIRHGASVRGAIDITELVQRLSTGPMLNHDSWIKAAVMALATRVELQDRTTQKMGDLIRNIVISVLEKYGKEMDMQTTHSPSGTAETKNEKLPILGPLQGMKEALRQGNLARAVHILQGEDDSVSKMLLDEDLFKTILDSVEHSEAKWPALQLLSMIQGNSDPRRKRIAKNVMNRIIRRIAAHLTARGIRHTVNVDVPFQPGLEEFDLEETFENSLGKSLLDYRDIVCIERRPKEAAYSLVLDASNSMQTDKILIAALAVGVFAYKLLHDHYSVLTFRDHVDLLKSMEDRPDVEALIDKMLDLKPGGSTNIQEALEKSLEQLEIKRELKRIGILITDGWVTKGGDPIKIAKRHPELSVIQVPIGIGGGDSHMCMNLAKAGRGRYCHIHNFYELPRAIMHITN